MKPIAQLSTKVGNKNFENFLLRWETILAGALLILLAVFFKENFWIIFLLTCMVIASRSSALYDHLKLEIHAVTILAVGNFFGAWPAVFIAIVSTPFINQVGKFLGSFQKPLWVLLDTIYLAILGIIASFIAPGNIQYYGFLAIIIVGNGFINGFRVLVFKDPIMRRFVLAMTNIGFNYILIWNFLPILLNFIK